MLTLDQKVQVLNHLLPDCSRIIDTVNETITWLDTRPMPTEAEMETTWDEIKLEVSQSRKREEIDRLRDEAFDFGMPWTFDTVEDFVQTRERDRTNLIAITVASILAVMNNQLSEPVVPFRAKSNSTYDILPPQAINLGVAALQYISAVYQHSWDLKDQVAAATTVEVIEAITWDWPPETP